MAGKSKALKVVLAVDSIIIFFSAINIIVNLVSLSKGINVFDIINLVLTIAFTSLMAVCLFKLVKDAAVGNEKYSNFNCQMLTAYVVFRTIAMIIAMILAGIFFLIPLILGIIPLSVGIIGIYYNRIYNGELKKEELPNQQVPMQAKPIAKSPRASGYR